MTLSLKIVFILASSEDPYEMLCNSISSGSSLFANLYPFPISSVKSVLNFLELCLSKDDIVT